MSMMMFNQLSEEEGEVMLSHQLGFENQENIQIQMSNFSKYFDVLLIQNVAHKNATDDANPLEFNVLMFVDMKVPQKMIDINNCKDLLKDIVTAAIEKNQFTATINMNIPKLNSGNILMIVEKMLESQKSVTKVQKDDDDDDDVDEENVDNNLKAIRETLMAIFKVVYNDNVDDDQKYDYTLMKFKDDGKTNSNNKKLTNNRKININNDNINFSYYCDDEYYEIIFNASVFLSKPIDDIDDNIGRITEMTIMKKTMNMMYQLQSHLIKSFIVNEMVKIDDENDDDKPSTTSQSNTNKSEYAFERTLNNFKHAEDDDDENDATVANNNNYINKSSFKSMIKMDSIPKLFSFKQRGCSFNDKSMMMQEFNAGRKNDDNDDAGYMMIISVQMQLLQSFNESDQQSGIVSNNSYNSIITKLINNFDKDEKVVEDGQIDEKKEYDDEDFGKMTTNNNNNGDEDVDQSKMKLMNIVSAFSHKNDGNGESLIVLKADDTVNNTCDFNYLNYNVKNKINDQNRKDETRIKDMEKIFSESKFNITTTTSTNNTSSLDNKTTKMNIDKLIECQRSENPLLIKNHDRRLRLCGGGEGSLSGASGWGSPPSANPPANTNNNPPAAQWGAPAQQAPQQSWNQAGQQNASATSQAQQVNPIVSGQQNAQGQNPNQKPLPAANQPTGWNQQPPPPQQQPQQPVPPGNGGQVLGGGVATAGAAKNQLEHLNTMREALFAQDGWGCQNVNQDTQWDVPGSPEPSPRNPTSAEPTTVTPWKSHQINNGTELWEANLRNGGQPAPQPIQKTPWTAPTNNIGGTWGEDDENQGDAVWQGNQAQQNAGWNQAQANPNANSNAPGMWPSTPAIGGVNANIPKKENEWGGAPSANAGWGDPRNPASGGAPAMMDPRDPRAPGADMRMMDSREMQGSVRGVTGRLNGSSDMWPHSGIQQPGVPGMNKIVGPGAGAVTGGNPQWPGGPQVGGGPKEHDMSKPSGWGESSPPTARRTMADDGTSLWSSRAPDANWKGGGVPNNFPGRNPGIAIGGNNNFQQNRIPNAGMKPDGNTWAGLHPGGGSRAAWDEQHTPNWEDKSHMGWNENSNTNLNPMWNKNEWQKGNELGNEWPQQNKIGNASSEIIRNSKIFRMLVESGFKKDDVEIALRTTNMNIEEASELLQQQQRNNSGIEWHGGSGGFDHSPFPGNRFAGPQNMQFPPNNAKLPNSNSTGPSANLGGLNNLPMPLNKHLPHPAGNPAFNPQQTVSASQGGAGGPPSTHHLRNLVQQIQKAVQAGYLNHQILNQPLAPQTLQLLNTLLTTIQQLQYTQQNIQRNGGVNSIQLQMTIQKHKQTITALQTQIAQQQSLYLKNQPGGGGGGIGSGNDFLRQNSVGMGHNDPISSIDSNLAVLNLNKDPNPYPANSTSQQSRLIQWKQPALDNKSNDPDFSRAPGTTSKQSLPPTTPTSISSIGLHSETSTWSSGRNDAGWPSEAEAENKDWPSSNQSPAFTDLVPEFQPGKPWKGAKNIEDDPSITPGSVARSLSISAAKEPDLFGSNTAKTSPNEILSSSTWSFNPSTSTQQNYSSTMPKLGTEQAKSTWSDSTSDLWSSSSIGKSTGPPPGLGSKNGATPSADGGAWMDSWNSSSSFSTWLLLKNLTTQIDGSTLRTLCVQHGPLQHFHLYLNHGIALCKYNSREEASKAQQALNNCVLGNTTICAESPSESEVQNILQHLGVPGSQGNGGNGNGGGNGGVVANPNANAAVANPSTWRPPSQQGPARGAGTDSTWGSDWPATNSAINW